GGGAHGMPFGAAGQLFIGHRHEFRFAKWLRPNISFGYSHLIDAELDAEFVRNEHDDDDHHDHDHWHDDHHDDHHDVDYGDGYRIVHNSDAKITQRPGVQAGLGLALPLEFAPRLSFYVQGDVADYFDR